MKSVKFSNSQIELKAVNAVVNAAVQPHSYLIPNIPVGDKGVSFDGDIQVFSDSSER